MIDRVWNPAVVDPSLDSRAATFENPTGARGAGGTAHGGRKGAPNRRLEPGERVVLADIEGPGIVRHIWMTFPPARPETHAGAVPRGVLRRRDEPSVSVPCLDFFGLPHGRPVAYDSALTAAQEGRGLQQLRPDAVRRAASASSSSTAAPTRARSSTTRSTTRCSPSCRRTSGCLHVSFRRENPTVHDARLRHRRRPPRARAASSAATSACASIDHGDWYGEGEVKIYRDGDTDAADDLRHRARGLRRQRVGHGRARARRTAVRRSIVESGHAARTPTSSASTAGTSPTRSCSSATCGSRSSRSARCSSPHGQEAELAAYEQTNPVAGEGWLRDVGARRCSRGASPNGSTTTARPRTSTASSRSRCPASTSTPRSPTSSAATTRTRSRKKSLSGAVDPTTA